MNPGENMSPAISYMNAFITPWARLWSSQEQGLCLFSSPLIQVDKNVETKGFRFFFFLNGFVLVICFFYYLYNLNKNINHITSLSSTAGFCCSPSRREEMEAKANTNFQGSSEHCSYCPMSIPHSPPAQSTSNMVWISHFGSRLSLMGNPSLFIYDSLRRSILPSSGQWDIRRGLVEASGKVPSWHKPGSWFQLHLGLSMNKETWTTNLLCYYDHERGQTGDGRPQLVEQRP